MKELPKISEAELEVMKVLWSNSPQTANEVIESLEVTMDWKQNRFSNVSMVQHLNLYL